MTAYIKLQQAHAAHCPYTKGKYKGDSPADTRSKSHFRIVTLPDCMAVIFHRTYIVKAYPDGKVVVTTGGYTGNPTTRDALAQALARAGINGRLYSKPLHGLSQTFLRYNYTVYLYKDGMEFDANNNLLTEEPTPLAKRINREEAKEFTQDIKQSGFKDMFAMLWATCTPDERTPSSGQDLRRELTDANLAYKWPALIAYYKYERRYDMQAHAYGFEVRSKLNGQPVTPKDTWNTLMALAKSTMYETVSAVPTNPSNI